MPASRSDNFFFDLMIREGRSFIGSDGSVPALRIKTIALSKSSSVPTHRFQDLIELNAAVVSQLTNLPSTVATLTKVEANKKVIDTERLTQNQAVNRSLRQLDRIILRYKSLLRSNKEIPEIYFKFFRSRLVTLMRNYKEGSFDIHRDWGKYRVNKNDKQLTFTRFSTNSSKPVYQFKMIIDDGFDTLDIKALSTKSKRFILTIPALN